MAKDFDRIRKQAFVILTGANALMAPIHHRMPVVLDKFQLDDWITPSGNNGGSTSHMLVPAADGCLAADPASPLVNSVKNDGPDL